MAIAFDQQLGSATATASTSSMAFTTANTVASNGFIVVGVGWFDGLAITLSSVAGGSLTWAVDKTFANGSVRIGLASAQAPAGLASGTTITATLSGNATGRGMGGASFTGIKTSAPLDTTASAAPANGTAWNAGALTTLNADDLLVGWSMGDSAAGTSSTATSPFIEVPATAGDFNSGAGGDTYTMVYRIVAATGTYTPAGAWLASQTNVGVSAAYMADTGGVATVPPLLLMAQPAAGGF